MVNRNIGTHLQSCQQSGQIHIYQYIKQFGQTHLAIWIGEYTRKLQEYQLLLGENTRKLQEDKLLYTRKLQEDELGGSYKEWLGLGYKLLQRTVEVTRRPAFTSGIH